MRVCQMLYMEMYLYRKSAIFNHTYNLKQVNIDELKNSLTWIIIIIVIDWWDL